MYAKLMSISDELMSTYFELATDVPLDEIREFEEQLASGAVHPKTVKQRLAREIVTIYHNADAAQVAEAEFDRVHRDRQLPDDSARSCYSGIFTHRWQDLDCPLDAASRFCPEFQ